MRYVFVPAVVLLLAVWCGPAEATRQFTATQINPPSSPTPPSFNMKATYPVTFRVTNTCTGSNASETITTVRFRTYSSWTTIASTTSAPPGWTRTAYSSSSVTFTANSPADRISTGNYKDFTLQLTMVSLSADDYDYLQDVRCTFSTGRRVTRSAIGYWYIKSLAMTLTPSVLNVCTNGTFTLTMSVTNNSTASLTGVTSVPKPPTLNTSGSPAPNPSTGSNPANLSLAPGATGTMVWTYSAGTRVGTVWFTAYARDSAGTRTSVSATSATISIVSCASIAVTISNNNPCVFSGDIATFVMTVTNPGVSPLTNVVPSALTRITTGSAVIGTFTGPSPASIASIPAGGNGTFTWTAPVTGNAADTPAPTFAVAGYATASGPITSPVATAVSQTIKGYILGWSPLETNEDSTHVDITWLVTNKGCGNINQVAISVPAGWTPSSDTYALVTNTAGSEVDTWTCSAGTFTAPGSTDRIPNNGSAGSFSMLFSSTPENTGVSTFTVTITDDQATPLVKAIPTTITVNPYGSGGLNETKTGTWQEVVR